MFSTALHSLESFPLNIVLRMSSIHLVLKAGPNKQDFVIVFCYINVEKS